MTLPLRYPNFGNLTLLQNSYDSNFNFIKICCKNDRCQQCLFFIHIYEFYLNIFRRMPVMPDVVVLFRMVLRSWNEEERKYLLSLQEIKEIDDLMSEMIHMIETNRFTRCFWDNFDRKFRNLSFLIHSAETKMGYISFAPILN
jgi:hypothetical protein